MRASGDEDFIFEHYCVAKILCIKPIVEIFLNIGAIDDKVITLSIEAVDLFALGVIETSLREIFRRADTRKFVIN